MILGLLELYEKVCCGKEYSHCRAWLMDACRYLDGIFYKLGKNELRFLWFKHLDSINDSIMGIIFQDCERTKVPADLERKILDYRENILSLRKRHSETPPGVSEKTAQTEFLLIQEMRRKIEEKRKLRIEYVPRRETRQAIVGRESELSKIRSAFESGCSIVWLYGIGGIGKTALAELYCSASESVYDQILFLTWQGNITNTFSDDSQFQFAGEGVPDRTQYTSKAYARWKLELLKKICPETALLIVLDNCDALKKNDIRKLCGIPCDILVTLRQKPELSEGQGYAFFVDTLRGESVWEEFYRLYASDQGAISEEDFRQYRKTIGDHTLMAKFWLQQGGKAGQSEFHKLLDGYRKNRVWDDILMSLSLLSPVGISEELFCKCEQIKPEELIPLKESGLISTVWEDGLRQIFLHPILVETMHLRMHKRGKLPVSFLTLFSSYAEQGWERTEKENLVLLPHVFSILDYFKNPVAALFAILDNLNTFLWIMGYFSEAEKYALKLYGKVEKAYGSSHQLTGQAALRVGAVYHNWMRPKDALLWYRLAYDTLKTASPYNGEYWYWRTDSVTKLARDFYHKKDWHRTLLFLKEAEACFEQYKQAAGSSSDEFLRRRMVIQYIYLEEAAVYRCQGDSAKGYRLALMAREMYPMADFRYGEFDTQLILCMLEEKRYGEALALATTNYEKIRAFRGDKFKDTISAGELLADVMRLSGEKEGARTLYEKCLITLQEADFVNAEWLQRIFQKCGGI